MTPPRVLAFICLHLIGCSDDGSWRCLTHKPHQQTNQNHQQSNPTLQERIFKKNQTEKCVLSIAQPVRACLSVHIIQPTENQQWMNPTNNTTQNMTLVVLSHWMGVLNFQNTGWKWRVVVYVHIWLMCNGGTQLEWNKLSTWGLKQWGRP